MIRVNLVGSAKKKAVKAARDGGGGESAKLLPIILLGIVVATIGGGYWWYSSLGGQVADLNTKLAQTQAQKASLDAVIQQDKKYEVLKKDLENRIIVIEGLKRNQVSPVVSLDSLDEAIDRTQFVWLSSLTQNNTLFTMAGTGTSVNAIADFVSNLEATGYFRNINLQNAQDAAGNFTFSMTCEFSPPVLPGAAASTAAAKGGN